MIDYFLLLVNFDSKSTFVIKYIIFILVDNVFDLVRQATTTSDDLLPFSFKWDLSIYSILRILSIILS